MPTKKGVWDVVCETYLGTEHFSKYFEIKTQLWNMKQGNKEVTQYYMEMVVLGQELDLTFIKSRNVQMIVYGIKRNWKEKGYSNFLLGLIEN